MFLRWSKSELDIYEKQNCKFSTRIFFFLPCMTMRNIGEAGSLRVRRQGGVEVLERRRNMVSLLIHLRFRTLCMQRLYRTTESYVSLSNLVSHGVRKPQANALIVSRRSSRATLLPRSEAPNMEWWYFPHVVARYDTSLVSAMKPPQRVSNPFMYSSGSIHQSDLSMLRSCTILMTYKHVHRPCHGPIDR